MEFFFKFDYEKYPFLPYIPASFDLFILFISLFITGGGNSIVLGCIIGVIIISALFSPDSKQSLYLLITSSILYSGILAINTFSIYPYINILNFSESSNIYIKATFSLIFFLLITIATYLAVSRFGKEQLKLEIKLKDYAEIANRERKKSEELLLAILPKDVANELKTEGKSLPKSYASVTVMFTDFVGFTKIAEKLSADKLVSELDRCFSYFDSLTKKYKLEKIKTIGDSYMTCAGIPKENNTHPVDSVLAAIEIQEFIAQMNLINGNPNNPFWELRLGINTGPLIAGVIGEMKFAYDVFGDTVNTASRMESSGGIGKINISKNTYELVKDFFDCEYRGKISAKNKGMIDMYFVNGIKKELSLGGAMKLPNDSFNKKYKELENKTKNTYLSI
ncbi:MAG: adenylate/guanylate cyclase domain-containing protein [Leptospiraceae bacterium]|nr:adenylate/guanylate cyclase domain-containing protein [Leptospiraceae bacterium]